MSVRILDKFDRIADLASLDLIEILQRKIQHFGICCQVSKHWARLLKIVHRDNLKISSLIAGEKTVCTYQMSIGQKSLFLRKDWQMRAPVKKFN